MTIKNAALAAALFGAFFCASAYAEEESSPHSDAALTRQVRRAISAHPALAGDPIHVRVVEGVAYLSGQVDTPQEMAMAESLAQSVGGIHVVVNSSNVSAGGN